MSFAACMPIILASEGGYSDNPSDPGGPTNFGINQKTLSAWIGRPASPRDVRALSQAVAERIYQVDYYEAAHCQQLPAGLDLMVFDEAVNQGVGRAIRSLQQAVGVTADGEFGAATAAAVKVCAASAAIDRIFDIRAAFYRGLADFPVFGAGWISRIERTRSVALNMAGPPTEVDGGPGKRPAPARLPSIRGPTPAPAADTRHSTQRSATTLAFRILSLDGGGTWALIEALALDALYPGRTGHQILAEFDLATGNSGGSIVLAGLALDFAPAQIADFFLDKAKRESIFHKRPFLDEELAIHLPIFPKYVTTQKRIGLAEAFGPAGGKRLADWPTSPDWPRGPAGEAVRLLIVGFDYDRARADFLRSYDVASTGAMAESVALVDAVHASTNAPVSFFDAPASISPKRYWDGAMGGYNNPLMAAVVDAIALGAEPRSIAALSLGTATTRLLPPDLAHASTPPDLVAKAATPGVIADAVKAAGCITDDPPDAATFTAHIVLQNHPSVVERVVRMNPVVQPVLDPVTEDWRYPNGLSASRFDALIKLGMDAVEAEDVALIQTLAAAWLADQVPNQPIRMGDDLSCALGDPRFSAARARWTALTGGPAAKVKAGRATAPKPPSAPGRASKAAAPADDCLSDHPVTAAEATADVDLPQADGGVAPLGAVPGGEP